MRSAGDDIHRPIEDLVSELNELRGRIARWKERAAGMPDHPGGPVRDDADFIRLAFDSIQDGISILDRDLNVVRVNRIMEEWYPRAVPLAGKKCYQAYHCRDRPCDVCPSLRAIRQKTVQSEIHQQYRVDGPARWLEIFSYPVIDEHGEVTGVIEHVRDITTRKEVEESQRLMQYMIDNTLDEASLARSDGRFCYVNDAKCRSLGYTRDELLSMNVWDVDPDMKAAEWPAIFQGLKERGSLKVETNHRKKNGETFQTEVWTTYLNFHGSEYVCAFVRDIADRKSAERSLKLTQFTMDRAGDMVLWVAPDSRYIYVNQAACEGFGYTRDEMIALTTFDTCPSWTQETWARHWEEIKEKGSFTIERQLRKKDGSNFPGEISVNYLVYDGQEYNCSFIRDITERKKAEEALKIASAYNRSLIEASLDPLVTIAPDGRITDVNAATETITGYTREQLVGTDFSDYFTEPDKAREGYMTVFNLGHVKDYPLEIRHRDGHLTPVIYNASVYRDEAGRVIGVFAAARDIKERKKALDALQESEWKFRALAETTKAGIALYRDKRFIYVNPTLEKVTGYTKYELMAMNYWDVVHPDHRELVRGRGLARQHGKDVPSTYEFKIVTRSGETRWVELSATPIEYEGRPTILSTVFDITDRKRSETELQDAKGQAELYLDLMGHDINNLNQIGIGFLEMALDTIKMTREERDLIARPLDALEASTRLIANVRKLQKIREGGLRFHDINVRKMIRDIVPRYTDVPGREVRINYEGGCDCVVRANDLLDDVFSNIIGNAIKHSIGPLSISVFVSNVTIGDRKYCLVAIEDTGPGIPDGLKERLFTRPDHSGRKGERKGLGMYLVNTLIQDFHGKVWVEDRVRGDHSKGARFMIMLPAAE